MPSATAVNLYPYPLDGDDPNIPRDIKALADRAEIVTNAQATLIGGKASSARLVAESVIQTGSANFTGTEIMVWQLGFTSLGTSEKYRVELQASPLNGGAGPGNGTLTFRWRTGAVTIVNTDNLFGSTTVTIPNGLVQVPLTRSFVITGVPAGAATVAIGGRISNGITCSLNGSSTDWRTLRVWDEGI